ncbi:hypothetical protein Droror1_Dr00017149 [Drosera rotundifolia]
MDMFALDEACTPGRSFLIYQKWSSRLDLRKMKHGEFSSRRMVLCFGACRIASLSL